jgi:hypothetical protein
VFKGKERVANGCLAPIGDDTSRVVVEDVAGIHVVVDKRIGNRQLLQTVARILQ